MKGIALFAPALVFTLAAQDLPARLQSAQRLRADEVRGLQAELAGSGADAARKAYFEAYAAYVVVSQFRAKEPATMEALLDRTLKSLESARDAESLALQGGCLGLKLGFKPAQGMTLSPLASMLFGQALALAPGNPRALFFQGLHVLHTPKFFGGGAAKALPILEAAAQAAETEAAPKDAWAPSWGKAETRAWLAYAQLEAGLRPEAKANCDKALALDPDYGFARMVVLPKLQEAAQ